MHSLIIHIICKLIDESLENNFGVSNQLNIIRLYLWTEME